jgi:FMN phosphatase YigB (HAD superfamily)
MLKAVLLDLDNTLILYDELTFISKYFPLGAEKFADVIPTDKFAEKLLLATLEMHKNDGSMSNRERFLQAFAPGVALSADEIWRRFDEFYSEDFDKFKYMVTRPDCAHDLFSHIKAKDLKIVIASNPIWPLAAQMRRLSWVGMDDIQIALVTHIDNMRFCKPHIGYYQQICSLISEKPEDCIMVGNDPANDMVAAKIGIKTYLTDDGVKHTEKSLELSKQVIGNTTEGIPPPDFEGPLCRVTDAIDRLLA